MGPIGCEEFLLTSPLKDGLLEVDPTIVVGVVITATDVATPLIVVNWMTVEAARVFGNPVLRLESACELDSNDGLVDEPERALLVSVFELVTVEAAVGDSAVGGSTVAEDGVAWTTLLEDSPA